MAEQSRTCASQVFWFTTLVASAASLKALPEQLRDLGATDVRIIDMGQGSKRSRLLAWTFLDKKQRRAWRRARWPDTRI
jgi:23S rRNA (adenine1618-N6)-methyltransferase